MAHRIEPRESGCPVHKQLLPVVVVWAPSRKKRNQQQHALNGNTFSPGRRVTLRSVRQCVHIANDDDLEPTMVLPTTALDAAVNEPVRLHNDLEARLERLFTRGQGLACTLIRPEDDVQDGDRRGHRCAQTAHPYGGTRLAQQARNAPTRIGRARSVLPLPSDYTPIEEVNILCSFDGNSYTRAHNGVLFTTTGFPGKAAKGFLVVRSAACQGQNDGAARSLP